MAEEGRGRKGRKRRCLKEEEVRKVKWNEENRK
jgi:hypothetical protein